MISRTAEYAVRAVIVLAHHFGEGLIGADVIASRVGAPRNYLSKILNALVRNGILTSVRGPGGGFSLALPPEALSVVAVVDVFDGSRPTGSRCLVREAACDPENPCAAHRRWLAIVDAGREPQLYTSISELSGNSRLGHAASRPVTATRPNYSGRTLPQQD